MDKVIKILEQHVQWLVLGLAALYVGWAGYTYLYKPPVTVTVGSPPTALPPGEVDPKIRDTSAHQLDVAIRNEVVTPPKVAQVVDIFRNGLGEHDINAVAVKFESSGTFGKGGPVAPTEVFVEDTVKDLPNPPPAMPDKVTTRWTVIMVPASGAAPAPAPAADPNVPAPAPAPVPMIRRDTAYVSMTFKPDWARIMSEITRCYSVKNVPPNLLTAEFVSVELLRQEQNANGTWNPPTVVQTLPIHDIMVDPTTLKPALAGDALKQALYKYKDWFEANQDVIVRPTFYQTAADSEPWVAPGEAPPAVQPGQVVAQRPFDPSRDIPHTPDEIRQKQMYQQNQEAARRERARAASGGRPGTGARPGSGGVAPFMPPGGGPPTPTPPPGYLIPREGARPTYPQQPGGGPPIGGGVPPAFINPNGGIQPPLNAGFGQDVIFLVHDTSIQEGKTYRYALRYKLFNPMWDHPSLVAKPEFAAKFDIDSPNPADPASIKKYNELKGPDGKLLSATPVDPEKLWTEAIKVDPLSHIFVAHISPFNNQAEFVVYTWKDGKWKETTVKKLMPGDPVSVGKSATPWTVVDVRKDPHSNEAYVILMDDHGLLSRRDEASDAQSPEWQKLKAEAGGSGAAAAAQ